MSPFAHILILIDCSPADEAIMDLVARLLEGSTSKVTLSHVVHSHTLDQDRVLKEQADACMESMIERFRALGAGPVNKLLLSGEPEEELEKEINQGDYDLVAMGTHGHTGFGDLLYGSVSRHLKHTISVPLLMVRNTETTSETAH
ncbi:universal stress protein [uncultured Sphaerochaeta sp.]|uniref:universal stress protein n=1 Tax=uncultured Sphaerochaeta sp. TaxID=886478 RepID=UPI002A0A631F|nr:universal stress protein [uncultured Sphaerochaeta sp.]